MMMMSTSNPLTSSVHHCRIHRASITLRWPVHGSMIYCRHSPRITVQPTCFSPALKAKPLTFATFGTCIRLGFVMAFSGTCKATETSHTATYAHPDYSAGPRNEMYESGEMFPGNESNRAEETSTELEKELMRRKKLRLAQTGKKHSAESRALMSQRKREAFRDPKVREKWSFAAKRRWAEFSKWRRMSDKLHLTWAESIIEAAGKGGIDEEELDWDSYIPTRRILGGWAVSDEFKAKISFLHRRRWAEFRKWIRFSDGMFLAWAEIIAEAARKGEISEEELEWDSYDRIESKIDHVGILYIPRATHEKEH
ncbi:hypothetical protein AKJ16_DCAP14744 [Drosera capensis]